MYDLNIPLVNLRVRKQGSREYIFDCLRKQYVRLTPEEWVRQNFINYLIRCKHYPIGLLANEIYIKLGKMNYRCDTILYDQLFRARMIIEYKSPNVILTKRCFEQIIRYNMILKAPWLIVSNGVHHYCFCINTEGKYNFMKEIPKYCDL